MYGAAGKGVVRSAETGSGRLPGVAAVVGLLFLALAGCATVPSPAPPSVEPYLLASEQVYFAFNVAENRELVTYLADSLGMKAAPIADRTDVIAGSVSLGAADGPALSGVAFGRFPRGAVRASLWRDRAFRRTVDTAGSRRIVFFRQADGSLEVLVPEPGVLLISTDSVVSLQRHTIAGYGPLCDVGPAAAVDRDVLGLLQSVADGEGPDLAVVITAPADILEGSLGLQMPGFLPASVMLTVRASDASGELPATLDLSGDFAFSSDSQATLFGRVGRVFVLAFVHGLGIDGAGLRDSVSMSSDGSHVRFSGISMTPDDLARLAGRFEGEAP